MHRNLLVLVVLATVFVFSYQQSFKCGVCIGACKGAGNSDYACTLACKKQCSGSLADLEGVEEKINQLKKRSSSLRRLVTRARNEGDALVENVVRSLAVKKIRKIKEKMQDLTDFGVRSIVLPDGSVVEFSFPRKLFNFKG
jgi:hypothetical protein